MNWQTVKNCGKIKEHYKAIPLNDGKIKTGQFLMETIEGFAKVCTQAYDNIDDFVFWYGERQLSALLLPAFYQLGYGALQELPTRKRKRGAEPSNGRLDYWVQKDDRWVFLIEAKHSWQCFGNPMTTTASDSLKAAVDQLKTIGRAEIAELSSSETTFRIALLVLPVYRKVPNDAEVSEGETYYTAPEELDEALAVVMESLPADVAWVGTWSLPERMQEVFQPQSTESLRVYPGVVLVASVLPM